MNFSVCLETIFTEVPFLQRLETLRKVGLSTFEFWTWPDKDSSQLKKLKTEYKLEVSLFTGVNEGLLSPGFLTSETRVKCLEELRQSIEVARQLGCKNLTVHVGNTSSLGRRANNKLRLRQNLIAGLKEAAGIASKNGITLLLEPLNTLIDHPDYFLDSAGEAFKILKEVDKPNIKLLYDIYHLQIMEGNLAANIKQNIDRIGYFHLAGVPGRHEPDRGEVNYTWLLPEIEKLGYKGYFGFEYFPTLPSVQSLTRVIKNLRPFPDSDS